MSQRKSHTALQQLVSLVGVWEMQASIGGRPVGRARTAFAWLEGGAFLVQRANVEPSVFEPPAEWVANSPFPLTTIFGLDDASETFFMLYSDARGVSRVYQMSLIDGVWQVWGKGVPGFFQRFTGTFSDNNKTITARWEKSGDGSHWEHDFDLTYTKIL
jgi:hypothetical protein